jgi:putative transposase
MFKKIDYFSEYELTGLFAEYRQEDYKKLPAMCSQQIIKNLFKNVKSWQKARKEYANNPSKFLGKPKMPNYKKDLSICFFTNQQVKIKNGFIHFPKLANILPIKTKVDNVQQVRIVPKKNHFVIEVVYTFKEQVQKDYNGNWMGIDLGVNNLATCTSNTESFLINGKPLKSTNHYYNKRKQYLQSKLKLNQFSSKRIDRITKKRNCKVDDYLHKSSRAIVNKAIETETTKIIIGKNNNWKQSINIGKKNNRQFVSIPHATLIEKIQYKAQMVGIEVIVTQEAYTSKCSAIDLEPICKHETYVGKRIKRGLFKTKEGKLINADSNGSLNVARLGLNASGNEITISELVLSCVSQPKKLSFS